MESKMNNDLKESVNAQEYVSTLIPYLYVLLIACWAGVVRYLNYLKSNNAKLDAFILIIEIITSGFVGICTYWLCLYYAADGTLTMFLVAISGHMGAKAIKFFEQGWINIMKNFGDLKNDSTAKKDGTELGGESDDS